MKKIYLLSAVALMASTMSSQVLESDNFNTYTAGNVGSDVTGVTPGQGDLYLYQGAPSDYQITQIDAAHGNSLTITTGATATAASVRYAFKDGLGDAWTNRTVGNDILQGTLEIYTGTSTGNNRAASNIYGTTAGIVGISYNTITKEINGAANLTNDSTGATGFFTITGLSTTKYPANTWVSVGYTYDPVNSAITYTINGVTTNLSITGYSISKGLTPVDHNFIGAYQASNTASMTAGFDNYTIRATNAALMSTSNVGQLGKAQVSVYPNPTTEFLYFSASVKNISIYDATGKKSVVAKGSDKQIDVKSLPKGVYFVTFESEGVTQTNKFIKK